MEQIINITDSTLHLVATPEMLCTLSVIGQTVITIQQRFYLVNKSCLQTLDNY